MSKEQPKLVLMIVGLLIAPLAIAAACGDGCSLDAKLTADHLFYALIGILVCMAALKVYIGILTIQENRSRRGGDQQS